jgi:hypothetical protein
MAATFISLILALSLIGVGEHLLGQRGLAIANYLSQLGMPAVTAAAAQPATTLLVEEINLIQPQNLVQLVDQIENFAFEAAQTGDLDLQASLELAASFIKDQKRESKPVKEDEEEGKETTKELITISTISEKNN